MTEITPLIPWLSAVIATATAVGCILLGYWMGRNSIERPMRSDSNPRRHDQGSTEEPGGDPFVAAMAEDDEDERRPTMLVGRR